MNQLRRNSLRISDDELYSKIRVIEEYFGINWLKRNDNNAIQLLWARNDELSTCELFSLADALSELVLIDEKWVKAQVKLAKSNSPNVSKGAIFEILAINICHSISTPIHPAKMNQAGFDAILRTDSQIIRVSIKHYGISSSQKRFENRAKYLVEKIKLLLQKYKYPPSQILLDFPSCFPSDDDWNLLFKNLDDIFVNQRSKLDPFNAMVEAADKTKELSKENSRIIFTISIYPIHFESQLFHPNFQSYTLMCCGLYHKNEELNLYSKIEEACSNLIKHSAIEDDSTLNSLFIRIPETIGLSNCMEWLDNYFTLYPEKPISLVILYQPTVVTDTETDLTSINNAVKVYSRNSIKIKQPLNFTFPVGTISEESSNIIFIAKNEKGVEVTAPIANRYIYQIGEHFLRMIMSEDGSYNGNIQKIGNGIYTSVVLDMFGQKDVSVISGRFPPNDNLLIL